MILNIQNTIFYGFFFELWIDESIKHKMKMKNNIITHILYDFYMKCTSRVDNSSVNNSNIKAFRQKPFLIIASM